MITPDIKDVVKKKYGEAALRVTTGGSSWAAPACCAKAACGCARQSKPDAMTGLRIAELPYRLLRFG